MVQLCKGEETVQCILEQKAYLPLPQKCGRYSLARLKTQSHQMFLKKKQNSGQEINVLRDFAKVILAL